MMIKNRFFKAVICILLLICLSGCWNSRELNALGIVMGIGVDRPDGPEKVKVTAQIVKAGEMAAAESAGGGSKGKAYWNVVNTGNSIFSTLRDMTNESSRKLFFPHNRVLIFGREVAEEGIADHLDFFFRDAETRLNILFFIAEDTAEEIFDVKCELEKVPSESIAKMIDVQAEAASQTMSVKLSDLKFRIMSKTFSPVAPIIETYGSGEEKGVNITGTAVFKKDKMIGRLDKTEGRGLLWVLGKVQSGIIEIKSPENHLVGMEIIRARGEFSPELKDGKVKVKVKIFEEGNLGEQEGPEDLSHPEQIKFLEKQKAEEIKKEVMAAVKKAQELNADIFGFGEAVHKKYPKEWKVMEDKWDEIFPDIEIDVSVETYIRLMGRINKPSIPE